MSESIDLNKVSNYFSDIKESDIHIFNSYSSIIVSLLDNIHNNITITKLDYLKYIILYGIEAITHIYKLLLLYTKNIKLIQHHCEKNILFYVEFITQIGDENHSFLQLSSKDAVLFLYKKTLFELNNEYIKKFDYNTNQDDKIKHFHIMSKMMISMIQHSLHNFSTMTNLMVDIKEIIKYIIHNKNFIIQYPNELYDISQYLIPITDSPILSMNKTLHIYKKKKHINVLEIVESISN